MGNEIAKTYWGVASVFNRKGECISAWLRTILCVKKPNDTSHSETKGIVFFDWFDSEDRAIQYLNDVKGGKK